MDSWGTFPSSTDDRRRAISTLHGPQVADQNNAIDLPFGGKATSFFPDPLAIVLTVSEEALLSTVKPLVEEKRTRISMGKKDVIKIYFFIVSSY